MRSEKYSKRNAEKTVKAHKEGYRKGCKSREEVNVKGGIVQ